MSDASKMLDTREALQALTRISILRDSILKCRDAISEAESDVANAANWRIANAHGFPIPHLEDQMARLEAELRGLQE